LEETGTDVGRRRYDWARNQLTSIIAVGVTVFHFVALALIPLDPWIFLGTSAHMFCILVFISHPLSLRRPNLSAAVDAALCAASAAVIAYLALNYSEMYDRVGFDPTTMDVVFGTIAFVVILEMARRSVGAVFPIIGVALVLYACYGNYIPGIWGNRGYEYGRVISTLFSTVGLYGFAMNAAASYIVLFVTFGAFMEATGVGEFFIRFANAVAGRSRGGPAKVCVVSSALFGMISGSSMGNVMTIGTFTIPLMKRTGYTPTFAGAVEAAASTGGQIMPPLMGAVAFVLADATGTPYRDVMLAAAIPAVCYFATVFFVTDFEALKQNLRPSADAEILSPWKVLREDWLLLMPIIMLVVMVVWLQHSITMSAIYSIGAAIMVDMIRRRSLPRPSMIWNALAAGSRNSMQAAAACAAAGILVGVFALTGLGNRFVMVATGLSGAYLVPALIVVMVLTLLMGFPLPTVPAYVITGMIGAPVIVRLSGVEPLAAHLFVMYFACVSTVTPPVGLAAFAAASISGANPYRTGFTAMRLGMAAYIVPFVFIFNPHLLGFGTWYQVTSALVMALAAGYALACAVNSDYHPLVRGVVALTAIPMMWPTVIVNAGGLLALLVIAYFGRKTSIAGAIALRPTPAAASGVGTRNSQPPKAAG
jgi:TRAP transporter 4TM/12TM fusion protein